MKKESNTTGRRVEALLPAFFVWVFLFPEVPLEETCEGLSMPGLVAGHFMDGVVDGVEIQLLGALGEGGLTGGGAVVPDGAECLGTLIFYGFWDDLSR